MSRSILIAIAALGFSVTVQAHILFEPFLGYQMSTVTSTTTGSAETELSGSSPAAGLRLGIVFPFRAFVTVDGLYTSGEVKPKEPVTSGGLEKYNAVETSGYVTLGYETMMRVRMWGSVGVFDSLQMKDAKNIPANDITYSGGVPFKAGLGYHLTQSIALNLEYLVHDYKKVKTTAFDNVNLRQAGLESVKASSFLLTLSAPIFW